MNDQKIISAGPSVPLEGLDDTDPESMAEWRVFSLTAADHGERLDRCLVRHVDGFSRSHLQGLLAQGCLWVNERLQTKPSTRGQAGDQCRLLLKPTEQAMAFLPQPLDLDLVYEDEHLLVLNKPAGLVVHPAAGHWSGTLLNGLLHHHGPAAQLPRAGIVHRLDKDTSGLMVVGKTRPCVDALVQLIGLRSVTRLYLAITGQPWMGSTPTEVHAPIGRDARNRLRMGVVAGGKPARTQFFPMVGNDSGALVACKLHTGRTHQIRVHLTHVKQPILADALYQGRTCSVLNRQALHAARLMFRHPVSGLLLDFKSPLPSDMRQACLERMLPYNGEVPSPDLFDTDPSEGP